MPRRVVNASQVLKDIRAGMRDATLMEKYNLSPVGLASLIKKLVEVGAVRQVSAKDLLRDIRSGMTNKELMTKYHLSARALRSLFNEMTDAGISFFREREGPRHKKSVNVREIVEDIRSAATESQLMEKHGLSSRGLQSTFWKLVHSNVLTWDELLRIYPDLDDSVTLRTIRKWIRSYPVFSIGVYEEGKPDNRGRIKDLAQAGIGTSGIRAETGERKTLVLVPDEVMEIKPFSLEAECKWFDPGGERQPCTAGFEIVGIEEEDVRELKELVQMMTLTFD
jgi:uncharacterized protein (DUF433 family)